MAATTSPDAVSGLREIMQARTAHYTTVGALAYSVIRQAILNGVLAPGEPLRHEALAKALGVSPIPVRSALQQLEADGLIEYRPHRGAIVTNLGPDRIREIYETRIVLECHAVRKAIERMTPERLAELESLAARLDATASGEAFVETRVQFYNVLYGAAGNELIVSMIEKLRSDVGRFWLRRRVAHAHETQHARLLDYVRARDADGAAGWLQTHLGEVAEKLAALAETGEAEAAS